MVAALGGNHPAAQLFLDDVAAGIEGLNRAVGAPGLALDMDPVCPLVGIAPVVVLDLGDVVGERLCLPGGIETLVGPAQCVIGLLAGVMLARPHPYSQTGMEILPPRFCWQKGAFKRK